MQPKYVGKKYYICVRVSQLLDKNIVIFLDFVMLVVFFSFFKFVICCDFSFKITINFRT